MKTKKRRAIPKKRRFEIFERDSFTCQFCGQSPPEVVLQLDHLVPHSKGGKDDEMNLITACVECNQGKSDKRLGDIQPKPDAEAARLKALQEAAEYERYLTASQAREVLQVAVIERLQDSWCMCFNSKTCPADHVVLGWLSRYKPDLIESAFQASIPAYSQGNIGMEQFNKMLAYVSAVMRNKAEEEEVSA